MSWSTTPVIAGPAAAIEDMDYDAWQRCLAVCLDSQFLACRRAVPVMKDQGSGSIINISSTAGLYGLPYRTPYAAAKWGVIGFTKSLAAEVGRWNIRVNAICPGAVEGARMERVIAAEAAGIRAHPEAIRADYTQGVSLKRFVKPEEIAAMALFLASPAANMVSGQAIAVDGHTETFHAEQAMDFALTDEQRMIVDTTRSFVEAELFPHERGGRAHRHPAPRAHGGHQGQGHRRRALCRQHARRDRRRWPRYLTWVLYEKELGRANYALHWTCVGDPPTSSMACTGEQRERYLLPCVRASVPTAWP
jgi:hypothetical protein